jgi:hypothetical protein
MKTYNKISCCREGFTVTALRMKVEERHGRCRMDILFALSAFVRAAEVRSFTIAERQLSA